MFKPGDTVRLTSAFLRSTGQQAGGEGQSGWTVRSVSKDGRVIVTDQKRQSMDDFTAEDISRQPDLIYRRILACNLEHCRAVTHANH